MAQGATPRVAVRSSILCGRGRAVSNESVIPRILVVLVVAAALVGVLVYSQSRPQSDHVSGFIEADEIRVASRVGGRVADVLVHEGQRVKRGDPLVELEPYDLLHRRAEAKAQR